MSKPKNAAKPVVRIESESDGPPADVGSGGAAGAAVSGVAAAFGVVAVGVVGRAIGA